MHTVTGFEDVSDTLWSWARFGWLVALLAVLGAVAGLGGSRLAGEDHEARSSLGLTGAVVWPFYDSVIEAHRVLLVGDQRVLEAAAAEAGVDPSELALEAQVANSSVIGIIARGPDAPSSATAANAAARTAVELGAQAGRESRLTDVARMDGLLAESQAASAALEADVIALRTTAQAAAPPERFALDAELSRAERALRAELDFADSVRSDRRRAERGLADERSPMEVLATASAGVVADSSRTVALIGGLLGALAGLAVAPMLDRRFGRIRGSGHVELRSLGGRWLESGPKGQPLPSAGAGALAAAVLQRGTGNLAVISLGSLSDSRALIDSVADRVTRPLWDGGLAEAPTAGVAVLEAGSVVVVARKGVTPRRVMARTLERLASLGVDVEMVLLLGRKEALVPVGVSASTGFVGAVDQPVG